jgi:dTDP-4-amino-4,6-dideoxygalactose transaminase
MQFVDLNTQHTELKIEIEAAINRVINESAFIRGPDVEAFEQAFAQLAGTKHCVSCANGTDAIYIALRALGAGAGDEVITTSHSWISTSETITQAGARVVFCDTEDDFFCLDPAKLEEKITPRTKGVIAVHLYGQPAKIAAISEICKRHGLWLIEDCAQAHLAKLDGIGVGQFGDVGTFSFYPSKNLGAIGDAGCLVTNRDDIAHFASLFARHGGKNDHTIEGICSRMDGLQAAVLNVKMTRLKTWTELRRAAALRYDDFLAPFKFIVCPKVRSGAEHVYHLYVVRSKQRDALHTHLAAQGIPTAIHYPRALPYYQAYSHLGHAPADFPIAHRHAKEILSLPMHPHLTEADQIKVAGAIRAFKSFI